MLYEHSFVKWYSGDYNDLIQFYQDLDHAEDEDKFQDEDYILIECCYDYPNIDGSENNRGGWYDNPWDARGVVMTRVEWRPTESVLET